MAKRPKTTKEPKHLFLFFLADTHAFHMCGLTPRNFKASTGATLALNEFQEYLLECRDHMVSILPSVIDGLFLVGDLGEGQNPAEHARSLSEVDPTFQARGVCQVLRPFIAKTRKVDGVKNIFMVHGSRYHTGRGAAIEEQAGQMMGARPRGPFYAPGWREIMVDGVLIDIGHRQSFTIRYSSMPMEREVGFKLEQTAEARETLPDEVLMVRAHVHKGLLVWRRGGITSVSLPPMKIQDEFAQSSIAPNRYIPANLGGVAVKIYKKPFNGKRVHVSEEYLYEHPRLEREEMPLG